MFFSIIVVSLSSYSWLSLGKRMSSLKVTWMGSTMDTGEEVYWIKPTLPTILGDLQELPVPGTDLIFASVRAKINFFTHGID